MKLKLLLITIILSIAQAVNAQKNSGVVGLYQEKTQSGSGGKTSIYILKDNTFAVIGYGTYISGTWTSAKNQVTLTPVNPQPRFELYGRHNPKLKKACKVMFHNFEKNETFIGLENEKEITLQRVFNKSANCLKFPNTYKFNKKVEALLFSGIVSDMPETKNSVYSFNIEKDFNEFIAYYVESSKYYKPIVFNIKKDGLQLIDEKEIMKKSNFKPKDLADLKEMQETIQKSKSRDILFVNPSYNIVGIKDINLEDYVFNEKKNEFTHKVSKPEKEALFQDLSLLYKYEKMNSVNILTTPFKINETNLFTAKCPEKGKEVQ